LLTLLFRLLNFAIAYATPYMVNSGSGYANLKSPVFFVWGSFCFVCIAFVWFMIYETKGLTLEQVDELYGIVSKAWKSKSFRPQVSFHEVEQSRGMSMSEMAQETERRRSKASVEGTEKI